MTGAIIHATTNLCSALTLGSRVARKGAAGRHRQGPLRDLSDDRHRHVAQRPHWDHMLTRLGSAAGAAELAIAGREQRAACSGAASICPARAGWLAGRHAGRHLSGNPPRCRAVRHPLRPQPPGAAAPASGAPAQSTNGCHHVPAQAHCMHLRLTPRLSYRGQLH